MRIEPRHFLLGLCLSLVGASPTREKASFRGDDSRLGRVSLCRP